MAARKERKAEEELELGRFLEHAPREAREIMAREEANRASQAEAREISASDGKEEEEECKDVAAKKKGRWSADEHCLFMMRLKEHGANLQWSTFAAGVPTRTGTQCRDRYIRLLAMGWLDDPNFKVSYDVVKKKCVVKEEYMSSVAWERKKRYSFAVLYDPSGVWTNLPGNHALCLRRYQTFNNVTMTNSIKRRRHN